VGTKVGGATKPLVIGRAIECVKPFPNGVELCMKRRPARGCSLHSVQDCAELGRAERYRVRFPAELAFCRTQQLGKVVVLVDRSSVGHCHRQTGVRRASRPKSWNLEIDASSSPRGTAAALVFVSACHVWKPIELGPTREFVNGRTRIERTDGTTMIMRGPRIVGDRVVGTHERTSARVALASADVRRMEVEQIDRGRTAVVGAGLLLLYWAFVATVSDFADPQVSLTPT